MYVCGKSLQISADTWGFQTCCFSLEVAGEIIKNQAAEKKDDI